jgi:hypothetical protein
MPVNNFAGELLATDICSQMYFAVGSTTKHPVGDHVLVSERLQLLRALHNEIKSRGIHLSFLALDRRE